MHLIAPSTHSPASARRSGMAVALMLTVSIGFTACKKEEPTQAPAAAKAEQPSAAPVAETPAKVPAAPTETPKAEAPAPGPKPVAAEQPVPAPAAPATADDPALANRVATFRALHPFNSGNDLVRLQQFSSALADLLDAIGNDAALLERVQKTVPGAEAYKLVAGHVALNLKLVNNSAPFAKRLLAVVLADKPAGLVDFVVNNSDGAAFTLSPK